jgi:hypothetical protein
LSARFAVVLAACVPCVSCYDPAHLDAVANLGDEAPNVPAGPTHRPGQPCTTCHGGLGPSDVEFSVAGTLFTVRGTKTPLAGGVVTVTDAVGASKTATSNDAGNFFIKKSDWDPAFRLSVFIEAQGLKKVMLTSIARDGGCGSCHQGAGDPTYMPGVYLREQ